MNRYLYYSIAMNMLINTILFVPNTLFEEKNNGVMMAFLLSIGIGSLFTYVFTNIMIQYPNKGLPEILQLHLPKWISSVVLIYLGFMWFAAGTIALNFFSIIIHEFISVNIPVQNILFLFVSIVSLCMLCETQSILFLLEMVLILCVPFISFLLFKALNSEFFNWYSVWDVVSDHLLQFPSIKALSASSYLFTGYINMAIFNRVFHGKLHLKHIWAVPIVGLGILTTTFIIPVGLQGTESIDQYVFPWLSASDALRMKFGFIERALFIFVLLYLMISLLFATVCWHVGLELIKSIQIKRLSAKKAWMIAAVFIFTSLSSGYYLTEKQLLQASQSWLELRFVSEALLVAFVYFLVKWRRAK